MHKSFFLKVLAHVLPLTKQIGENETNLHFTRDGLPLRGLDSPKSYTFSRR